MKSLIRSAWLRHSGNYWTVITIAFAVLFSQGTLSLAASHVGKTRQGRWIEVNLSNQQLIAWENGRRVYSMPVSTGKHSTPTRQGTFSIQSKLRSTRMQGSDYDVANVPYTMYFSGGYAIHGAYWHHRFGTPVSHGCVNVPVGQAHRLFRWASVGTQVVVH